MVGHTFLLVFCCFTSRECMYYSSRDDATTLDVRPRPRQSGKWLLSDYLHDFLSNLPPRLAANTSPHTVHPYDPWLTRQLGTVFVCFVACSLCHSTPFNRSTCQKLDASAFMTGMFGFTFFSQNLYACMYVHFFRR